MSNIVNGRPTKSLFIDALTKDIELIDAVGDLVDNSADAAFRLKGKDAYNGLHVKISFSSKSFTIEDNCGGIPLKVAKNIAFRLGRPTGVNAPAGLIGRYGIGMKRAFFKIGRNIVVESFTPTSHLKVPIDIDSWRKDDSDKWDFKATIYKDRMRNPPNKIGTRIEITKLNDEIANEILQHDGRCVEILGDVIKPEKNIHRARTENALRARYLAVKKFIADGRCIAVLRSHRTADTGQ